METNTVRVAIFANTDNEGMEPMTKSMNIDPAITVGDLTNLLYKEKFLYNPYNWSCSCDMGLTIGEVAGDLGSVVIKYIGSAA